MSDEYSSKNLEFEPTRVLKSVTAAQERLDVRSGCHAAKILPVGVRGTKNVCCLSSLLSNLHKRLMHLHHGHSCGLPSHYVDTCQWNFRSPGIQHCLAILFQFRDRTRLFLWQLMLKDIPVGDIQQLRPSDPSYRHTQFPMHHCKIFPLFLLTFDFHLLTLRRCLQAKHDF